MRKDIPNRLKLEIMNHLAEHMSFKKVSDIFPMISMKDIQNVIYQAAEYFQGDSISKLDVLDSKFDHLHLYTDGASRGNPGEAGAGVVILDKAGNVIKESKEYLGNTTNNSAEYRALILGLQEVLKLGGTKVNIFSDSELMVKQIKGFYNVKNQGLILLYNEVNELLEKFIKYDIKHIKRARNSHADRLANEAIDKRRVQNIQE
ncbi:MAG: ribonuclease HI family protein [Thermodesulfobacteriota bacterium]|nr:ribonuclease HI family protein [Thermodesulfobacteriota bacterium]